MPRSSRPARRRQLAPSGSPGRPEHRRSPPWSSGDRLRQHCHASRPRQVGCMPAHPELGRRRSDRVAVDVDHVCYPTPGPFGQRRPRTDLRRRLRPGSRLSVGIGPHQHGRRPRDRKVPHQRPGPTMTHRPGPTPRTASRPHPRSSRRTATTRQPPAPGHRPRTRASPPEQWRHGYLESRTRVPLSADVNPQNGGTLARVDGLPNQPRHLTTPHASSRRASLPPYSPPSSRRWASRAASSLLRTWSFCSTLVM
jgi:hypothetical protein